MPSSASFMRAVHSSKNVHDAVEAIRKQDARERDGAFLVVPFSNSEDAAVQFAIVIGITCGLNSNRQHPVKLLQIKYTKKGFSLKDDTQAVSADKLFDLIDYYVKGGAGAAQLQMIHKISGFRDSEKKTHEKSSLEMHRAIYNESDPGEHRSWFHADIFGHRATKILGQQHVKDGSFLVRYSFTKPGQYSLSVKVPSHHNNPSSVKHIRIVKHVDGKSNEQDGWCLEGMPSIVGKTLDELIDKYQDEPFVDDSRNAIKINVAHANKYARNTSVVHGQQIEDHLKKIQKLRVVDDTNPYFMGAETCDLDEEWEMMQESDKSEKMFDPQHRQYRSTNAANDLNNSQKNRYANILPYDHSRVVLKYGLVSENQAHKTQHIQHNNHTGGNLTSEYVNANLIARWGTQNRGRTYVACQGPLDDNNVRKNNKQNTMCDFWRTVIVCKVRIIIMATNLEENGTPKCGRYWPEINEGTKKFYQEDNKSEPIIEVTQLDVVCENDDVYTERKFFVKPLLLEQVGDADLVNGWEVTQYQFKKWPDHGVLQDPFYIIDFLQKIHSKYEVLAHVNKEIEQMEQGKPTEKYPDGGKGKEVITKAMGKPKELKVLRQEISNSLKASMENKLDNLGSEGAAGPLLVHCSAGVGRTGTFIAIDMLMDKLRWFGMNTEIDIFSTVQHIRNYRMSMVQSPDQYEFIYKALKCHIQGLVVRNFPADVRDMKVRGTGGGGGEPFDKKLTRNKNTIKGTPVKANKI